MIKIRKDPNKDFKILNLTDVHTENDKLAPDCEARAVLEGTVKELVETVRPDLITLSGDLAWGGHFEAYEYLRDFMDGFGVPWSLVWGNHDQEKGYDVLDKTVDIFCNSKNFVYEQGPSELGRGNFVIAICEGEKIVEALLMMDTHNRFKYINKDGQEQWYWGKLYPEQIQWYEEQVHSLSEQGCKETMLITHQPIYAYRYAIEAALKGGIDRKSVSVADSFKGECWNEEYRGSFGMNYEDICCYLEDDGFFDVITKLGSTKTVVAGHDHVNCSCIDYKGVRLTYGLKTGLGAYWRPDMNGGTVFTVTSKGVTEITHRFMDPSRWIKA